MNTTLRIVDQGCPSVVARLGSVGLFLVLSQIEKKLCALDLLITAFSTMNNLLNLCKLSPKRSNYVTTVDWIASRSPMIGYFIVI